MIASSKVSFEIGSNQINFVFAFDKKILVIACDQVFSTLTLIVLFLSGA